MSEVSPNGEVLGKLNFIASVSYATSLCAAQLHFRGSENFTNRKRADTLGLMPCVFALSVVIKGLDLARFGFDRSNAMLALSGIFQILR